VSHILDRRTLDDLVALGRAKGHLTTDDLQAALPTQAMAAEDIALIVVHLEDAGIAVELDENLLSRSARGAPEKVAGVEIVPLQQPSHATLPLVAAADDGPGEGQLTERTAGAGWAGPAAHIAVIVAGVLVLALLALGLWAL